jgi:hypothetical protein
MDHWRRLLAVIPLAIFLLGGATILRTPQVVRAAPAEQSVEDRIRGTLDDAAAALGGGFVLNASTFWYSERTTTVGTNDVNYAVDLTEAISIRTWRGGAQAYCAQLQSNSPLWHARTFHGMAGCYLNDGGTVMMGWGSTQGAEISGAQLVFSADARLGYGCGQGDAGDQKAGCDTVQVLPIAEALHQAAISNGLSEATSEDAQPIVPGDNPSIQPDVPVSSVQQTNIPLPIAMGNVAVPLAGAVAGTLLALGLSGLSSASSAASSAGSVTSSRFGDMNEQGMVWSDRPWDEAGPGYVTRDEYERTRTLRSKGYEWTKDGWQTPDERQQSQQWDAKDRDAVKRADGDWKAKQDDQRKQLEIEQQKERTRLIESYLPPDTPPPAPAPTGQESPWQFDPSLEAGGSGDLGTGTIDPNVGGSVTVYKNAYYDMPDRKDDITLFGWDIGNYKCDVQVGKVQAGAGASINPDKPESQQVGLGGSVSAIQLTGEAVLGNKYLGLTFDSTVEGPKGEAFVGYKDGGAGGALGASAGSVDVGLGVNAGAVNVSGRVGLNAGMEFSLKLGTQGEVKFGPFKLGYSLGWAKTGN